MNMGRMKTISQMLDEGASINALSAQLREWDETLTSREALKTAYQYMKEWKANESRSE